MKRNKNKALAQGNNLDLGINQMVVKKAVRHPRNQNLLNQAQTLMSQALVVINKVMKALRRKKRRKKRRAPNPKTLKNLLSLKKIAFLHSNLFLKT